MEPARLRSAVALAADRKAWIAIVNVTVKDGQEMPFLEETIINARNSFREPGNLRFDVMQSIDDPRNFLLFEAYDSADGPVAHKATDHYNAWRDIVADMMAEPRTAQQFDVVYPQDPNVLEPDVLIVERPGAGFMFEVQHEYGELIPDERAFPYFEEINDVYSQRTSDGEKECMRCDVLRDAENPNKFLIQRVYRNAAAMKQHKVTDHYIRWRRDMAGLMKSDRYVKRYVTLWPNVPATWKIKR